MQLKVLIIGPSITRTKGGMATVINNTLLLNQNNQEFLFTHLVSHVEGSFIERVLLNIKSLLQTIKRRNNFDIAHIHVASYGSFFRKSLFVHLCRLLHKPVILHVHGADFDHFYLKSAGPVQRFIRSTFSAAARVFVLSAYWRDFFKKHISSGNIEIVHNGVDVGAFKTCISAQKDFSQFLFLGRLGKRKGIYDLLKAIEKIKELDKELQLHFWIAGDGEIEEVRRLVDKYQLNNLITVVGWLNDVEKLKYLKMVDSMVLPSYDEGLPMSLLEAMACGKIIISTPVGGIPDLVINEQNGFLVQPGDVNALYDCIKKVNQQKEQMLIVFENNIKRIEESYNLRKINNQVLEIYRTVWTIHSMA